MKSMQDNKKELSSEQKLVIICSRLTFAQQQIEQIDELRSEKLDWYKILNYCIKNKVVSLVWFNVKKWNLNVNVPNPLFDIFEYYTYMTGLRNEILINEAHRIQKCLMKNGIKAIPLKGLIIIPQIYKSLQIRHMNDIDMMIDMAQRNEIEKYMLELGFIQGRPDRLKDKIINYSRSEQIAWSMKMNNMPLYTIMRDEMYARFVEVDFTFGIDFNRKNSAVSKMLSNSHYDKETDFECLDSIDFFIHLCAHLYKEATTAVSVVYFQDINLIKFCDVREYFVKCYNEKWFKSMIKRAEKYDALKAVYYSLYYSFILFEDDQYFDCLKLFNLENTSFLYGFGQHEWGKMYEWKKGFYERIFAQNNIDEITERPEITLI